MPIPQIRKMCKRKSAKDVSGIYLGFKLFGRIILAIYGIMLFQYPIMIPAPISACEIIAMLIMKHVYDKREFEEKIKKELNKETMDIELCEIIIDS
jgi:uncharacterized protein with PQ loop repeat